MAQAKDTTGVSASVRIVRRVVALVDWLQYSKVEQTLSLSFAHKTARLAWAKDMLDARTDWSRVAF